MFVNIKKIPKGALSPSLKVKVKKGSGDAAKLVNLYPSTVKFSMVKLRNFEVDEEGSLLFNDGVKITETEMTLLDGTVVDINGVVTYQDIKFYPTGAVKFPNGLVKFPNGDITLEDGTHIRKLSGSNDIVHTLPSGIYFKREYVAAAGGVSEHYKNFVIHRQDGFYSEDGGSTWEHDYLSISEAQGYQQIVTPLDGATDEDVRTLPDGTLIIKARQFKYNKESYARSWATATDDPTEYLYNVRNPDGTIFTAYGQIINTDGTIIDEWYNIHFPNGNIRTRDHKFILPDGSNVYSDGAKLFIHGGTSTTDDGVKSPFGVEPITYNTDLSEEETGATAQTDLAENSALHPQNYLTPPSISEKIDKFIDLDAAQTEVKVFGSVPADFTDRPNEGLAINTSVETSGVAPVSVENDDYVYDDFIEDGDGTQIDEDSYGVSSFEYDDEIFQTQSYSADIEPHTLASGETVSYDEAAPGLDHFPFTLGTPKIDAATALSTMIKDETQTIRAVYNNCTTSEGGLAIALGAPVSSHNLVENIDPQAGDIVHVMASKSTESTKEYYFTSTTGIRIYTYDTGPDSEGQYLDILVSSGSSTLVANTVDGPPKGIEVHKDDYNGVTVAEIVAKINGLGATLRAELIGTNAKFVNASEAGLATYKDKVFTVYEGLDHGIRLAYSDATSITLLESSGTSAKDVDGNVTIYLGASPWPANTTALVSKINTESVAQSLGITAYGLGRSVEFKAGDLVDTDILKATEESRPFVMDLTDGTSRNTNVAGTNMDKVLAETSRIYAENGKTELITTETSLVYWSGSNITVAHPIPSTASDAVVMIDSIPQITELEYRWSGSDTNAPGQYLAWFTFTDADGTLHRIPERSDDLLVVHVFEDLPMHHAN